MVKAGDTLYDVRTRYDGSIEMASSQVVKVTEKFAWLDGCSCAFGYRKSIPLSVAEKQLSASAAMEVFQANTSRQLKVLERDYNERRDALNNLMYQAAVWFTKDNDNA